MRILFYSDNLYPETSGISDSIIACARGLRDRGHTVGFVGPKYARKDYAKIGKTPESPSPLDGFEVYRIPSLPYPGSASGQARNVIPIGWSLPFVRRFRPDVIHSQSPFGTGIDALIVSRFLGIPLVGTNHTSIGEFIRVYGPIRTKWAESVMGRFYSWYYNRCAFVSAVFDELLEDMRSHGFKRAADIVPNPVSLDIFSPRREGEKEAMKKVLGLSGPVVICAGRVAPDKRIHVIVEGFSELVRTVPNAKLVLVGNGPAEQALKKQVVDSGLSSSVVFPGFLDHATLAKWYTAADVFTVMCPIETQCLSMMQAFGVGLPAVGVAAGAVGIHIQPEWGETVPLDDASALAKALARILKDPKGAAQKGAMARAYVERFSENAIASLWEQIDERLIQAGAFELAPKALPRVSVVIPAHNEENVIAATLRTVLEQDYPDFEVIVVDNASSDRTSEVARSFAVRVVHEPKKGLLHARECGRKEATGEIIVQMDADCLPESDWLSRGVAHFSDPRIAAAAGPYDYFDGQPFFRAFSLFSQRYVYKGMSVIIQTLGMGAVLIGGNSFIRASALEKEGGYNTDLAFYGEDTDTARRVVRHGKVVFDRHLIQKTSARRFKAEGSFKITVLYLFHFFKVLFMGAKRRKA